jgi:hypothetical protein
MAESVESETIWSGGEMNLHAQPITSLDAAMTILFHIANQRRGASEFLR